MAPSVILRLLATIGVEVAPDVSGPQCSSQPWAHGSDAGRSGPHLQRTRLEHPARCLAEEQTVRLDFARLRLETDRTRGLLEDTLAAIENGRPEAILRVLELKATASESVRLVTDLAMKICGGAAFRKELTNERVVWRHVMPLP